jgi:hypothetical protein
LAFYNPRLRMIDRSRQCPDDLNLAEAAEAAGRLWKT